MSTSLVCAVAEKISCQSSTLSAGGSSPASGVVKSFNKVKGYGFVRIENAAEDVYFKTEDFSPRSKERALQVYSVTGAPITCTPEEFGKGRARARSVRLVDEANRLNVGATEPATATTANIEEASVNVAPSISKAALRLPSAKKVASSRPRGWGVPSSAERKSQEAQLMAMGFTEEAAHDALSSGVDFNTVLDALLSGEALPTLATRRPSGDSLQTMGSSSELDSCPTTRAGSDDASDNTSACDSAEKSPEARSLEPDMDITSPKPEDELLLEPDAVLLVTAEELDLPLDLSAALQSCAEVAPECSPPDEATKAVDIKVLETAGLPARQLARVLHALPEGCDAASLLSVQPGTLIYVWADSATEHGWIYAERLDKGSLAGWLPADMLKLLPATLQFRSASKKCPSFSDQHLAAEQGDIMLVDAEYCEHADEGAWIHAERLDGTQAGWFPTAALSEMSAKLQWMHVVNSQTALHASQVSVEENDLLLVDPETRTKEGWAYAWTADRHRSSAQAGWVPVSCLRWPQEQ